MTHQVNARRAPVALLLAALLLLIAPLASRAAEEAAEGAAEARAPRPVVTEIVSADPTRQRAFPGTIEAKHQAELAFQTIGRIARLDVAPGDVVARDEVLAVLDRVSLQEDLRAAEAALSSARAEADFAEQSYSRVRALADRDIAAQAQVEQALANRDATAAQVAAAEADLAAAQEALTYGSLTAPMDGVVLDTPVETGTVVSAGTTVVVLAGLTDREAVIDVPGDFLKLLPEDARFELRRHEGGERAVPARLRLVEPVADEALRARRLRLTITGDESVFRIGSLISATYKAEAEAVMTLPRAAIIGADGDPAVWRVGPGARRVHRVPVTLGAVIGDRVEIRSGIAVGDEIIVRGAQSLEDGQPVGEREQ
ncbi:Macrolide export protein MacA [Pseudooceanicola marinus]|uniref:Macrolide export protein MacA n=1 Tax=Pseudooceanicola marinus TaxID=396013 RepID=A0A1X6Z5I7_9RHOB|nr:efflux RND transporter periplasmic adaptor subunit [Pseudooceanicola marinus]PJE32331.1 efflux RND transporter periplasmic adaptor subunit [Pseudooceanicola marinus]SLN39391.1 Macrolide export protein MacA [Pseudooceanicola marinus]